MTITDIAKRLGLDPVDIRHFIAGKANINLAGEFGVTKSALQDFIDGNVQENVSMVFGLSRNELQELRNVLDRDEAINLVLKHCLRKKAPQLA